LQAKYDVVGDVRGGEGLMAALELVGDGKTPAGMDVMSHVFEAAYEAGAMVRIGGNNLLMSPPLIIEEAEVETILSALDHGLSTL
jgi:adenosylmethionine-8-amino-7-oxononanoate aminotransferase